MALRRRRAAFAQADRAGAASEITESVQDTWGRISAWASKAGRKRPSEGLRRPARRQVELRCRARGGEGSRGEFKARSDLRREKYDASRSSDKNARAGGAGDDATEAVVAALVAVRRLRRRFALGANDAAMRGGGRRGEQALQQKRKQRDHADRDARCNPSFACLHHLVKIGRFGLQGNIGARCFLLRGDFVRQCIQAATACAYSGTRAKLIPGAAMRRFGAKRRRPRMANEVSGRPRAAPASRLLALALGAAAVGAVAIGAVAIGRLAVGRLVVRKARFAALEVDRADGAPPAHPGDRHAGGVRLLPRPTSSRPACRRIPCVRGTGSGRWGGNRACGRACIDSPGHPVPCRGRRMVPLYRLWPDAPKARMKTERRPPQRRF